MSLENKTVILMVNDALVLKGLQLLLEDMDFQVVSVSQYAELTNISITNTKRPELLILPYEFGHDKLGNDLVKELRARFQQRIPAILLSQDNGMTHTRYVDEGVIVLSAQIKPKDLRNKITAILRKELAV